MESEDRGKSGVLNVYPEYLYILRSVCAHFEPEASKMWSTNSLKMYKYFWIMVKVTALFEKRYQEYSENTSLKNKYKNNS